MRVAVPFRKTKIYTGIAYKIHQNTPQAYEAKDIFQILDEKPVITPLQLKHWEWIAEYYMCTLGEVMRAGLPSYFLLESETTVSKNPAFTDLNSLSEEEYLVYEYLNEHEKVKVDDVQKILDRKNILPLIKNLIEKEVVFAREEIYERYRVKKVRYVRLNTKYENEEALNRLLDELGRAEKQRSVILNYFQLKTHSEYITPSKLRKRSGVSDGVIKALIDKQILESYYLQEDRVSFDTELEPLKQLNEIQQTAAGEIEKSFAEKDVVLLHGITSSGKTEIYAKLIDQTIKSGKQVLYLLPEIALTTQIIVRLQKYFGNRISVFHSRYSLNERVEVWNHMLNGNENSQLILGARSAVLLPFRNIGLIIVDEEHETSYKQFDPAPRYHARDAAVVLAKLHNARILLGSATPSVESYYNTKNGKYGLVELNRRYGNVRLPDIELTDIKEKYRKKRMSGHFSDRLIELIREALDLKEQIILFQNRRGYAPVVECTSCGVSPQCPNCDVSLTYHKFRNVMRCHYCGHEVPMPVTCPACNSPTLDTKGFGTEQIELELNDLFPDARVARMDLDTTRGKYSYQKILSDFHEHETDILVGTQMLSKGLDFNNVSLVGILNADNMLNFPDFRAHERSYQLMAQVSGRAGRAQKRGKVIIQTFNPYHQILQQVSVNDYEGMYRDQINERHEFLYPPVVRLVKITLKYKDAYKLTSAANWLATSLRSAFGDFVLGPATPSVSRIRKLYIRTLLIKLPRNRTLKSSKTAILKIRNTFEAVPEYRSIRFIIDVDSF